MSTFHLLTICQWCILYNYLKLKAVANFYLIIFIACVVIGIFYIIVENNENATIFISVGVSIQILAFLFLKAGKDREKENAWVECKNLKGKANINQVQKTIDEVRNFKESNNKDYTIVETYFVSASGFIENAIKLAEDNGIKCYVVESGTFKKIDYWNH